MKMRLNRYIAQNSSISRREADELISQKRVKVNNTVAQLGMQIETEIDHVYVDFKHIKPSLSFTYLLVNKPKNVITSRNDDKHRPTVMDIVPAKFEKLKPAGRLDFDSEGLLILTDDGDFIEYLTHPRNHVVKEYEAKIFGRLSSEEIDRLQKGIRIKGIMYRFNSIEEKRYLRKTEKSFVKITLTHGKNREIKNALMGLGHPVIILQRVRIGNFTVNMLKGKKYIEFHKEEFRKDV